MVGAHYFWFPKMTGRMLDERLGRWNFWTMFIGFNVAFLPMHLTGLLGMPRRVYTYTDGMGWDTLNLITSIGSFVFAIGVLLFFINVLQEPAERRSCRGQSLGCADTGMVGALPAAAVQLRRHSHSAPRGIRCGRTGSDERARHSSIDRGMLLDRARRRSAHRRWMPSRT